VKEKLSKDQLTNLPKSHAGEYFDRLVLENGGGKGLQEG
jgi:hypothetical protein